TNLSVGQRVAGGTFGVWAEYSVAKAAGLVPVPDAMTDEDAAQLVSMPFSAISLLHSLDLHEGDWLIQNAANGAVGRMVAQLGKARGINVIGLVRRAAGVEELREQGIDRIVATDSDDWQNQVLAITGGAPIIAGVESVGGKAAGDIASVMGENGTLV
ncbi:zinc-binding dehydrogenase, partial [Xanthomonas citri pv. citri]